MLNQAEPQTDQSVLLDRLKRALEANESGLMLRTALLLFKIEAAESAGILERGNYLVDGDSHTALQPEDIAREQMMLDTNDSMASLIEVLLGATNGVSVHDAALRLTTQLCKALVSDAI